MHLLRPTVSQAQTGQAVDIDQTRGDIVFLSAADSELAILAKSYAAMGAPRPSLRLVNLLQLSHNLSIDIYANKVIGQARIVIVRLLGGRSYWPYGVEKLREVAGDHNIPIAFLPGHDDMDHELRGLSTIDDKSWQRLWYYCLHGGRDNALSLLRYTASLIGIERSDWTEPKAFLKAGLYWPGHERPSIDDLEQTWLRQSHRVGIAAIVFYRALLQAGQTTPIDQLITACRRYKLQAMPIYVTSLKDAEVLAVMQEICRPYPPAIIINTTGFAVGKDKGSLWDGLNIPTLQAIITSTTIDQWKRAKNGLIPRDIAMHVALPEVDGRIITTAIAFKSKPTYDKHTQAQIATYRSSRNQADYVGTLAKNWVSLGRKKPIQRRIGLILANYPNRDGRLANGVGLDTPASLHNILIALKKAGYDTGNLPEDGAEIIACLRQGPTNDWKNLNKKRIKIRLKVTIYRRWLSSLPPDIITSLTDRWGEPKNDPFVQDGCFCLPALTFGNITIGLQPLRGYHLCPEKTYHDPELVPPHCYVAFYLWLRYQQKIDAIVHVGKHGNLEWLPGKALALSNHCFPQVLLGAIPHFYPFIVNDPGEGAQAKRRTAAVIIDHMTPPLTQAGSYGDLRDLEHLSDEYAQAAHLDPKRAKVLEQQILDQASVIGLIADIDGNQCLDPLNAIDNHLCELKEMQIRDGLHILGQAAEGTQRAPLLSALARRGRGQGTSAIPGLTQALAKDLGLADFNPLTCQPTTPWQGKRPKILTNILADPWRHHGDTVERLEALALELIEGQTQPHPNWKHSPPVLDWINDTVVQLLEDSATKEIQSLLDGLSGRLVEPGPAGAPSRGRLDVLPTGRNFYSVDTRTVPTPTAWRLGWESAQCLVEDYQRRHGEWPKNIALSAWGTANMRTGGEDIAQALALIGARPQWDNDSNRVSGIEVLPSQMLGRPRVDVTLRVSGFFRDAFSNVISLFNQAARLVSNINESDNPLYQRSAALQAAMVKRGLDEKEAKRRSRWRVFGTKPGTYGTGLQSMIDENHWNDEADLATTWTNWGCYAYDEQAKAHTEPLLFTDHLRSIDAVVHNQDNREHDILDSDDYYQFSGGWALAIRHVTGHQPAIYHNDHANPDRLRIRSLSEEIGRVVRGRAANPKWISGVMRHGYKGAFEIAATVDYLFAFAVTAKVVKNHHFDALYQAYIEDETVRSFMAKNNPDALYETAKRFDEAIKRSLWYPRANSVHRMLNTILDSQSS